jgi:RimJ/RimL family protein N-acetyltransferase
VSKRPLGELPGQRVRLRLLSEGDLETTLAWRNQDRIRKWFFTPDVITPEQHHAWFAKYRERDDDFVFIIEETRDLGRPVGQVALYRVDWAKGCAEYGRLMIGDAEAAGKGLAREATALLLDAAFGRWGLREVYLEVMEGNAPAIALYEKCGFGREEGAPPGVVRMERRRP